MSPGGQFRVSLDSMGGLGRVATPAAGCARCGGRASRVRRRAQVSRATHALLPPCWTLGVCPPSLAAARPGGRCFARAPALSSHDRPPVRADARMGGQPARVSVLAGGHGWLGARRDACGRVRALRWSRFAGSSSCAGFPSYACPPAAVLDARRLSSQPRFARPGGRCFARAPALSSHDRPPVRADARLGGQPARVRALAGGHG